MQPSLLFFSKDRVVPGGGHTVLILAKQPLLRSLSSCVRHSTLQTCHLLLSNSILEVPRNSYLIRLGQECLDRFPVTGKLRISRFREKLESNWFFCDAAAR